MSRYTFRFCNQQMIVLTIALFLPLLTAVHLPQPVIAGLKVYMISRCLEQREPRPPDYLGSPVTLEISVSKTALINSDPIAISKLPKILSDVYSNRIDRDIFVSVDRYIEYADFIKILDSIIQKVHLNHMVILTKRSLRDFSDNTCTLDFSKWRQ